ncbi:hypothetical protein Sgleb_73010 [Streptomyces glebosus]|uniref:Uncharacterized protein n=1 Tax=Streptomyces glebosus TaxID=249580 RepID=A0A640T7T2_9ACTN|nr:hypothetical protein [Streptomyces glebosus]GFE19254.1 hypothetical protein Sgleb_73010 [Streptomyces glebosus]GHG78964.1 hypothetical protein GCM10010513_55900 [Streptomyces glebosus]
MSSPCDPKYAPAGDVGTALMIIDSRLKAVYDHKTDTDPEQQQLIDQFAASLGPTGVDALLDGVCTLIYMLMKWLRTACEDHDKDVIEYSVPALVATMRMMPKTFRPEVIPTMAGLLVAAGTGLSPNLWRAQYGRWTEAEMNPLEATAVLLAEHINRIADDHDFATRLITEALSSSDQG